MLNNGNLYCFIGKSGSGKTAVMNRLQAEYGYSIAESYTDRPKRTPDERGHVFLFSEEFSALPHLLLPTTISGYRYGMTKEMLDEKDLIVLDSKGVKELKATYKGKNIVVIGIHAPTETLAARMRQRGDTEENMQRRLSCDAVAFQDMFDLCDVVFTNDFLEDTVLAVQHYISLMEQKTWTLTDDDCLQYRRRLPDHNGAPVFELVQIVEVGSDYRVAHGRLYFSDYDQDDIQDVCESYGLTLEGVLEFGEDTWGIIAEALFETEFMGFLATGTFLSFDDAASFVRGIVG